MRRIIPECILGGSSHLVSGLVHPRYKWTLPPLIPFVTGVVFNCLSSTTCSPSSCDSQLATRITLDVAPLPSDRSILSAARGRRTASKQVATHMGVSEDENKPSSSHLSREYDDNPLELVILFSYIFRQPYIENG